ncbi:MAG: hypothetical protein HYV03_02460 [Deltaproteobacteria bacterium]|nr:hypothetical protein [Deltaproteobacteria bacterium]
MGPEGWQTASQITITVGSIVAILGGYGLWHFGKQIEKDKTMMTSDKSANPSAPVPSSQTNQSHTGSGDNVAGNKFEYNFHKPQSPELRTIEESQSDNADGTHSLIRTVEMNASYAGNLVITIRAEGLLSVDVGQGARQQRLPDGNIMTITGGGTLRDTTEMENFYTTTVPAPSGRYVITVVTKRKIDIKINTVFQ